MRYVILVFFLNLIVSSSQQHTLYKPQRSTDESIVIYVIDHGWHTGVIIPAQKIRAELQPLNDRFPDANLIEFGWGDKNFYQSKEIKVSFAIRALFLPTDTVVHAVAVPRNPYSYFPTAQITKLFIEPKNFETLRQFIISSFSKDSQNQIIADTYGIYGDSHFYAGKGVYHIMQTCNKWTAQALQAAGLKIKPMFRLTADSITYAPIVESARLRAGVVPEKTQTFKSVPLKLFKVHQEIFSTQMIDAVDSDKTNQK